MIVFKEKLLGTNILVCIRLICSKSCIIITKYILKYIKFLLVISFVLLVFIIYSFSLYFQVSFYLNYYKLSISEKNYIAKILLNFWGDWSILILKLNYKFLLKYTIKGVNRIRIVIK